jgi:hypothetical protein
MTLKLPIKRSPITVLTVSGYYAKAVAAKKKK